jgi:hypothetical protein
LKQRTRRSDISSSNEHLLYSSKQCETFFPPRYGGFKRIDDLLKASAADSICPAICMLEGCDFTTEMEPDQREGYCEACGGRTVMSVLVLAGII